jgi:hypothetical protein
MNQNIYSLFEEHMIELNRNLRDSGVYEKAFTAFAEANKRFETEHEQEFREAVKRIGETIHRGMRRNHVDLI